jgi:futalosine hydrolase
MKILILAATAPELFGLKDRLPADAFTLKASGIGMVNMALACQQAIWTERPSLVVQVGICGSFSAAYPIGSVVQVQEEIYSELGADSPEGFLDLEALGFPLFQVGEQIWYNRMHNPSKPLPALAEVTGITVNRVHGVGSVISQTRQFWNPDIESMEGAALFQVCLGAGIPFYEIRSVSNYVEDRNRAGWNIPLALKSLSDTVIDLHDSGLLVNSGKG